MTTKLASEFFNKIRAYFADIMGGGCKAGPFGE